MLYEWTLHLEIYERIREERYPPSMGDLALAKANEFNRAKLAEQLRDILSLIA